MSEVLIQKDELIAGFPAVALRDVMRELRQCAMSARALARLLGADDAARALADLEAAGLVEVRPAQQAGRYSVAPGEDPRATELYRTSVAGNALAKARIGKHTTRERASEILRALLERVEAENADPDGLFWVETVGLFGSYADESRQLVGDVDLQVVYSQRYDTEEHQRRNDALIEQAWNEGHAGPTSVFDQLTWAESRLFKRLRARQPRLDIQFDRAGAEHPLPAGVTLREVYRRSAAQPG